MIRKLRVLLRDDGPRAAAGAVLRRLGTVFCRSEQLIVIVKDLDAIVEPRRPGDLRVEDLEAGHLSGLSELNRKRDRPGVDRRFAKSVARGFHGFVAIREGEIVGYYWWVDRDNVMHPDLRKLGLGIELGEGDVYGSDLFLLDEHRGAGTAGAFLFELETSLRDRGYRCLWGYVAKGNRPARWLYSSRGYRPMWTVFSRRFLFLRRRRAVPTTTE